VNYDEISSPIRKFLGGWQAMRQLGFSADDLYFVTAMSARHRTLSIFVKLTTQGKEFLLEVASIDSEAAAQAEYQTVSKAMAKGEIPIEDVARMFEESEAFQRGREFVAALMSKGFVIPSGGSEP